MAFKNILDSAKTLAVETGEKIIGRGPEVKFRHEVQDLVKNGGLTQEQAEKQIFNNRIGDMNSEVAVNGTYTKDSKSWRAFEAAINETLSDEERENLEKNANNPAIRTPNVNMPANVYARRYSRQESYFKSKFNNNAPKPAILKDCTQTARLIEAYSVAVETDVTANLGNNRSLEDLVKADPMLSAELGKMLQAKELLEKHENKFKKDRNYAETVTEANTEAKKILTTMLYKAPAQFLKEILGTRGAINKGSLFSGFAKACLATGKFIFKEAGESVKLAYQTTKVVGSAIKNKTI